MKVFKEEVDLDCFLQSSEKFFVNPPQRVDEDSINVVEFFEKTIKPIEQNINTNERE